MSHAVLARVRDVLIEFTVHEFTVLHSKILSAS